MTKNEETHLKEVTPFALPLRRYTLIPPQRGSGDLYSENFNYFPDFNQIRYLSTELNSEQLLFLRLALPSFAHSLEGAYYA